MRLTEEQYELIEAYLNNELSAPDRASFERDVQADAELQAEIDRQRDLRLGLRAMGIERALERARVNYKTSAATATSANTESTVVRQLPVWRYWAAAASVVIVLGVGYYAYQQTASRQVDIAYAETVTPDTNDELLKSFPSENIAPQTRTTFFDAFRDYKAGKYNQVIEQLKTLPADKQTIHYKNYFLGLSYLANKQPINAIPLLSKAQASPNLRIKQKAQWFLALAYIKNNQNKRALLILNRISIDKAHPFQSLAKRVLQKVQ